MADATNATATVSDAGQSADGTRLSVLHRTTFRYSGPVTRSQNTLHLEPRTFPLQKTISAIIRVLPATRLKRFSDLFQNVTHHFELPQAHDKLEIESRIKVHNLPLELSAEAMAATLDESRAAEVREIIWPYLQETRQVEKNPEAWKQALDLTRELPAIHDKASTIMSWIHEKFSYEPGSTAVQTRLAESYAMRRGVCQDFTHVMLGMCRTIGVAARYASGYLYNGPTDHLVGAQASHAWPEIYLPGMGWVGYDPTNNNLADERYIKVAVGRDYDDVAPVEGTYMGSGHCQMEVLVQVEKL